MVAILYLEHSKTGPFKNQTKVDHSKTGHVWFSDPHCIWILTKLDMLHHLLNKSSVKIVKAVPVVIAAVDVVVGVVVVV